VRAALPAAGVAVVLAAGCGRGSNGPPATIGRIHLLSASSADARACLRLLHVVARPRVGVEQSGASGRSVTFRVGRLVLGCDQAPASRRGWCAGAVGLIAGGRLADPRLDIACRGADGRPVGFGWIEPLREAATISLLGPDGPETYRVAGGLPVRVTTTRVSLDSGVFEVVQYAPDGHELERRRIVMRVAG
jgi:hypothetical protein